MTTDDNKAIVRRFIREVFVEGRKDAVLRNKLGKTGAKFSSARS